MKKKYFILQNVNRIGHLFMEPFFANVFFGGPDKFTIGISPSIPIANQFALELMNRHYDVMAMNDYNEVVTLLNNNNALHIKTDTTEIYRFGDYLRKSYYELLHQPNFSPFHYEFTPEENKKGEKLKKKLGIPKGASWICLHNREPGYLPSLTYHSYRDANIMNFIPAINYLVDTGFWIVRIGDTTMTPLPEIKQVIDLPFNEYRTDFADIWLLVNSYFYIATGSGPYSIPVTFGKPPMLCVNLIGVRSGLHGTDDRDTYLYKMLYSKKVNRMLSFPEMMYPGVISVFADDYKKRGLDVIENSSEDILNAVIEMLENMDKTPEDIQKASPLNQKIKHQIAKMQLCEDIIGGELLPPSIKYFRLAESFLEAHPEILDDSLG